MPNNFPVERRLIASEQYDKYFYLLDDENCIVAKLDNFEDAKWIAAKLELADKLKTYVLKRGHAEDCTQPYCCDCVVHKHKDCSCGLTTIFPEL